jgi:hypothetical protein
MVLSLWSVAAAQARAFDPFIQVLNRSRHWFDGRWRSTLIKDSSISGIL